MSFLKINMLCKDSFCSVLVYLFGLTFDVWIVHLHVVALCFYSGPKAQKNILNTNFL